MGLVYVFGFVGICALAIIIYNLVKYPDVYFKKKKQA